MKIAIKLGTSTLTHNTGKLNIRRVENLCKVISDLANAGNEIIIISSGAIAMGAGKMNMKSKPTDIPTKQAAAAVGQCELMYTYDSEFSKYNHTVAQILLTNDDFGHEDRFGNFKNTINRLLELGVIPVINENDTVSTDEIVIGDNDTLAAIVSAAVSADILVLLSDIDGLYTDDPHASPDAKLISEVTEISDDIRSSAKGKGSEFGTGGMETKIRAASICMEAGCDMVIANGADPEILYSICRGERVGTRFISGGRK